jgi:uncharacterized membrane protein YedE/YeeE
MQMELDRFADGRWPWWVAGPALGLLVVGFFLVSNQPLGASGAYAETAKVLTGRKDAVSWRVWYLIGIPVGGFLGITLVGNGFEARTGYEPLVEAWNSNWIVGAVVLVGATVMGYGARMAGGCTSGHGICGTAQRSPASLAATGTFMAVAIATTYLLGFAGVK